jgi:rhodanese-related sulfurtransferase
MLVAKVEVVIAKVEVVIAKVEVVIAKADAVVERGGVRFPDFQNFATRAAKELDPGKPLLVYCRSGRRSAEAAAALVKLGFADVRNLEGGILAWGKSRQVDRQARVIPSIP